MVLSVLFLLSHLTSQVQNFSAKLGSSNKALSVNLTVGN